MQHFGRDISLTLVKCVCCFSCIRSHSDEGCDQCILFLKTFFPTTHSFKLSKPVARELKSALKDLFMAMEISEIRVENELEIDCCSFIGDLLKVLDEINQPADIVRFWHISEELAIKIFSIVYAVLHDEDSASSDSENCTDDESDTEDITSPEESDEDSDSPDEN